MGETEARTKTGRLLNFRDDAKIGEGGEKEFYYTKDPSLVVGFYKWEDPKNRFKRLQRLEKILGEYNPTTYQGSSTHWKERFCWPVDLVIEPRLGVVYPWYPKEFYFEDDKKEKRAKWFFSERLLAKIEEAERGDWFKRLIACRQLSQALDRLHSTGLAHSDLSSSNVLVNLRSGNILLTDIDSLVVPGMFPPEVLGTRGYVAPEVVATSKLPFGHPRKKLPCINTDLHSLAVIIYELLLLRHPLEGRKIFHEDQEMDDLMRFGEKALFIEHPDDKSNSREGDFVHFDSLGPYLKPLFLRAFVEGLHQPSQRPNAIEWEDALTKTIDILHPCSGSHCQSKWFPFSAEMGRQCPFCGWSPSHHVPVMDLFRGYLPGRYRHDMRKITVWDGLTLHRWHAEAETKYPIHLPSKKNVRASFIFNNGVWILENASHILMKSHEIGILTFGSRLNLCNGESILLSQSENGNVGITTFC